MAILAHERTGSPVATRPTHETRPGSKIEMYRRGKGWLPASEDAERVHDRMVEGEIGWFKPIRVRDPVAHRRYWKLMTMCAQHCERIQLPRGGWIEIHSKDDVHTAIKICAGHVDWILDEWGKPVAALPKSTDYESMTADEWAEYWPQVLDVVEERVMRNVRDPDVQFELQRLMGWAR